MSAKDFPQSDDVRQALEKWSEFVPDGMVEDIWLNLVQPNAVNARLCQAAQNLRQHLVTREGAGLEWMHGAFNGEAALKDFDAALDAWEQSA